MGVFRWCASSASRVEVSNPAQPAPAELGASVPSGPTNNTMHMKLRIKPFSLTNSQQRTLEGSALSNTRLSNLQTGNKGRHVLVTGHLRVAPFALSKTQALIAPSALCRYG